MTRKQKLSDLIESYVAANDRESLARKEKQSLAELIDRMLGPVPQGEIRRPIAVLTPARKTLVAYFNGQGDQSRLSYVNDVELIDE